MKKTIITCAAILIGLLFISCGSTNELNTAADEYADAKEISAPAVDSENGEAVEINKQDTVVITQGKKKKKNFVEEIFTFGNKDTYEKFEDFSFFEKDITGLKEKKATQVIRTDNYMAGWGSYYLLAYYIVQFDETGRKQLLQAINSYMSDFENKNLKRKGKHTERTYGKVSYRLDWGTIANSTPNYGSGEGYVGYEFIKNSPYFVISNYPFENQYFERSGETVSRESMQLAYYFTRSQLRILAEYLAEDNIKKIVLDMNQYLAPATIDEY